MLYIIILLLLVIFLLRMYYLATHKPPYFTNTTITKTDLAIRGRIYSDDNYLLSYNHKVYNVTVRPQYINKNRKELFATLLSIYTDKPKSYFLKKIDTNKTVVLLLKEIKFNQKTRLEYLSKVLTLKKVFNSVNGNSNLIYGLDIYEKKSVRKYPFQDSLEPVLGLIRYNKELKKVMGTIGIERYYEEILRPKQNGYIKGVRDVRNNIIYDSSTIVKPRIDGDNVKLNIDFILQKKIEKILDQFKEQLKAQQVMAVVMESNSGKIRAIATSNRYNPNHLSQKELVNLTIGFIQYTYEPGSVMKPIILANLLKLGKVSLFDKFNAYNGAYRFSRNFTIYDDEKFKELSVIDAVVHSSNIVFSQLGLKLTPSEFRDGLLSFGLGKKSGIDLPFEYRGFLFSTKELSNKIHRASNSFGYGLRVNLIQLLKAYNSFNNNGIMVTPKIAKSYGDREVVGEERVVLAPDIAKKVLNVLRRVVLEGTARRTNIDGLFIAGKTGTARISSEGGYNKEFYNSSFIGFVNDRYQHRYTIGVLVVKPDKKHYFASQSAVKVFKKIVETMVKMRKIIKN